LDGFFADSLMTTGRKPLPVVAQCGACGLHKGCKNPKLDVSGSGRKGVLIVAEAPGKTEDERGTQLIGRSGQFLQKHLRAIGVDMRRDCWVHNALSCWPGDGNKIPKSEMIDYCRPRVVDSINKLQPSVIILLGKSAIASVLGHLWKEDVGGTKRWAGFTIPCREPNAWVACTYHPSFVMREKADAELYARVYQSHLKAAFEKAGTRPWEVIPDEADSVVSLPPQEAAPVLRRWIKKGGTVAFDYETNRLKPDHPDREIVAVGACYEGRATIAFPFRGEGAIAFRELLRAPNVRKVGWNLQFEQRWTRKAMGCKVESWLFDGMQAAHVLDCRRGIVGLKFQAFVRLGFPDYNSRVAPYLSGVEPGGNSPNRIREVDMPSLLLYCGTDALLTFKICRQQMIELGWE